MRGSRRRWASLMVAFLMLTILQPGEAGADLGDVQITGTVTDAVGTPLANVRIADALKAVYTDINGNYSIDEPLGQDFTLTASRTGLYAANKSGTALPATRIDFILRYMIATMVSPTAFNTLPKPLNLTARSYAPTTSCVSWIDGTSGTSVALTYQSTDGAGESTWTGQYVVLAGRPEGAHSYTSVGQSCAQGTDLTKRISGSYVVDLTPPRLTAVSPLNSGNVDVTLGGLPVVAKAEEPLSGIDPSTVLVTIDDLNDPAPPATVSHTISGDIIRSTSVSTTVGHRYRAVVTGSDNAGNAAQALVVVFESVTFDISRPGLSDVASDPPRSESADLLNDRYYFDHVLANLGSFTLTMSDNLHIGALVAEGRVNAQLFKVLYKAAGVPFERSVVETDDRLVYQNIDVPDAGPVSQSVPSSWKAIGSLTAVVPKGATDVRLAATPTDIVYAVDLCADVTSASSYCRPDPLLQRASVTSLANGAQVELFGSSCSDVLVRVSGPADGTPGGVAYEVDQSCQLSNATDIRIEDLIPDPLPGPSPPPPASRTYNHVYTWIDGVAGDMLGEFETVTRHWWNGQFGWWRDQSCCTGWAYGIARDWWPHWDAEKPTIAYTNNDCTQYGPPTCADRHYSAWIEEVFHVEMFGAGCGAVENGVAVVHNHQVNKNGSMSPIIHVSPCPGAEFHHVNFNDGGMKRGVFVDGGETSELEL